MSKWKSDGDWIYEVAANGTECTIRKYEGKNESIVVPEQCGGYPVTAFGNDVSCVFTFPKVQIVVFPSTVVRITSCAFLCCKTLEKVILPMSLLSIGDNAFLGCTSLKSIELPISISCIEYRTFSCCESLVSVTIPSSVKKIKSLSFLGCYKLNQVIFNEGLESIGHYAFGLTSISKVVLPDSIISVEHDSFNEGVFVEDICRTP